MKDVEEEAAEQLYWRGYNHPTRSTLSEWKRDAIPIQELEREIDARKLFHPPTLLRFLFSILSVEFMPACEIDK